MSVPPAPEYPAPARSAPVTPEEPAGAAVPSVLEEGGGPGRGDAVPGQGGAAPEQGGAPEQDSAAEGVVHEQRIRSFHPRRGRITVAQADARERLWERYGFRTDGRPLDLGALFGDPGAPGDPAPPVVLEIGFGMGEATAAMAAADPGTGILGCDVHTPGQGNLLHLIEKTGLRNVRIADGDAVVLLRDMLPPGSLAGLRVFFPDPWPKKRHHKRRLIQPGFVRLAVSRLAPGAVVHCATDWEPYAEQMLEVLGAEPELVNRYDGFAPRPAFRPLTKFERQGLRKGHVVRDLLFERR